MLFDTLITAVLMLALAGFGIFVGIFVAAFVAMLVFVGIVSTATLIGIIRRRFSSGLRALHYLFLSAAAVPTGVAVLWLGSKVFPHISKRDVLLAGSIGGLLGGLLFAFVLDRIVVFICRRLQ